MQRLSVALGILCDRRERRVLDLAGGPCLRVGRAVSSSSNLGRCSIGQISQVLSSVVQKCWSVSKKMFSEIALLWRERASITVDSSR
jgi:hypothetical protein